MCDTRIKLDHISKRTTHMYQSEDRARHRAVIKPSGNFDKFAVAANYTVNMIPFIGAATIRKLSPPNVKDVHLVTLPEQRTIDQTVDHTSSGFREWRFVPTGDESIRIGSKSVHWGKISGKVELDLQKLGRLREYFLLNRGIAQGEWHQIEASSKTENSLSKIIARKQNGTLVGYPDLTALSSHLKLVGHSMGGAIAAYAGAKHHVPFEVFNPLGLGSGILSTLKKEDIRVAKEQSACYIDEGDWVSDPRHPKGGLLAFAPNVTLTARRNSPA